MRTNIKLPETDLCTFCNENCPDNIYDCNILNQAINKKDVIYCWCWIKKE